MKRFKMVGLCLVAAIALAGVMASAAQAGEIGACVKQKGGKYEDKVCSKTATEAKKGKYEWVPAAGLKYTSEEGVSHLKGGAGAITCQHSSDEGEFLNATENTDTFKYFECTLEPYGFSCQNTANPGEIVTDVLTSHLLDHGEKGVGGKEPAEGEAWIEYRRVVLHGILYEFECLGIPFKVSGSVSGTLNNLDIGLKAGKPGKETKKGRKPGKPSFDETFSASGGEQDLNVTFFNPETDKEETGPAIQEGVNGVLLTVKKEEIKT